MTEKNLNNHIHAVEGTKPMLLEMPHSGLVGFEPTDIIHHCLAHKLNCDSGQFRKAAGGGCDSSVPEMTGFHDLLNNRGLYGIYNDLARVLCDTNRERTEVSDWAVEGGSTNDHHHGAIWASVPLTDVDLSLSDEKLKEMLNNKAERTLKQPLTRVEFDMYMKETYDQYHAELQRLHKKMISEYGFGIHVALHSMPPFSVKKINGAYILGQKAERGPFDPDRNTLPDVILIHNGYKAANKVLVESLRHSFQSAGLIVEDGKGPFIGNIGVTKKYGNPELGVNVIGIEHVAHDLEPERHLGNPTVNLPEARKLQSVYRKAISRLL